MAGSDKAGQNDKTTQDKRDGSSTWTDKPTPFRESIDYSENPKSGVVEVTDTLKPPPPHKK